MSIKISALTTMSPVTSDDYIPVTDTGTLVTKKVTQGTLMRAPTYTVATLPAAGNAGQLAWVTDGEINLYIDNGAAWTAVAPHYSYDNWTPSVGGSATYSVQSGSYVKIGRIVHISCFLLINAIGTGSVNTISGLPFPSMSSPVIDQPLAIGYYSDLGVSVVSLNATVFSNGSTITIYGQTSGGISAVADSFISDNTYITIGGSYRTAS